MLSAFSICKILHESGPWKANAAIEWLISSIVTSNPIAVSNKVPEKNIVFVQGKGKGKGSAVREGIKKATGDICMILDADLTVTPEDLPQFYNAMKYRRADFVHGTRMVYAQKKDSMRFANIIGNLFFSPYHISHIC